MALDPVIGAIAAGNTVVLKPSELSPASSSLLANALPTYLDNNAVKVIEGNAIVCEQLLQHKWDKIFFTGIYIYVYVIIIFLHFIILIHYVGKKAVISQC